MLEEVFAAKGDFITVQMNNFAMFHDAVILCGFFAIVF
jgi:hypothetical protein